MEKIKYLFLLLIVFGCIPNDKTATEYYVLGNPLYDYDVEEKIKNLNITLPVPGTLLLTMFQPSGSLRRKTLCWFMFLALGQEERMAII